MNLQQLRFVSEIVDRGLNISRAAEALNVAQPAISRQIQLLEKEIGAVIFIRNQKRIISLSEPGNAILKIARRMLQDAESVKKIGAEHSRPNEGELTVATNHTYASYVLPSLIEKYSGEFPGVRLALYEGTPNEIGKWLASGMADISISTKPSRRYDNLVFLPLQTLQRVIIVPVGHKLLRKRPITLADLGAYPIITFHTDVPGGENITRSFKLAGVIPHFKVKAANADVIKAYVRRGLGVGVVSQLGVSPTEDGDLRTIDASYLFPAHEMHLGLRRGGYMRSYVYEFLRRVAPSKTADIEKFAAVRKH
jgi:LysR family cys regulon transcriptional activator